MSQRPALGKGLEAFNLEGRVAVVTGARTGIGQGIALGLAAAGARLVLWGHDRTLGETADIVRESGRLVRTHAADLPHPLRAKDPRSAGLADTQGPLLPNIAPI